MEHFVLVKDWGREGLTVHGSTTSLTMAQTWSRGGSDNKFVVVQDDLPPECCNLTVEDF